ncbi:unnamed protein product [Paramecium primaurelia]|uniref:Uncharacterized protein n=1 Tax=Paramecium primaurelia TaxID=5886 RepID=A0A8S1NLD9_PARPR|nr:unnamed protein product [Paramecium primaurelia]
MQISEINITNRITKRNKEQKNQILRLKQFQQVFIKQTDQDLFNDPETGKRINNYMLIINAQEFKTILEKQINQLKHEYQDNIKTKKQIKQISFEKTQLKMKLEDQIITDNQMYQQNQRLRTRVQIINSFNFLNIIEIRREIQLYIYINLLILSILIQQIKKNYNYYLKILDTVNNNNKNIKYQIYKVISIYVESNKVIISFQRDVESNKVIISFQRD